MSLGYFCDGTISWPASPAVMTAVGVALQGAARAADHAAPVPGSGLAKLTQRRIPRTVIPILEPAEAGVETVQQPNRFSECAGQMRNRRIDADHEIEAVFESRRIGKVM